MFNVLFLLFWSLKNSRQIGSLEFFFLSLSFFPSRYFTLCCITVSLYFSGWKIFLCNCIYIYIYICAKLYFSCTSDINRDIYLDYNKILNYILLSRIFFYMCKYCVHMYIYIYVSKSWRLSPSHLHARMRLKRSLRFFSSSSFSSNPFISSPFFCVGFRFLSLIFLFFPFSYFYLCFVSFCSFYFYPLFFLFVLSSFSAFSIFAFYCFLLYLRFSFILCFLFFLQIFFSTFSLFIFASSLF